jgi:uncharacterized membrane protein YvbJ
MYCTNCGKSLSEKAKFCNHCGETTHKNSSTEKIENQLTHPSSPQSNKRRSSQEGIATVIFVLLTAIEGIWKIIVAVLVIIGIWIFITHLGQIDPSSASIPDLQNMTCKQFLSTSENNRLEIGNRLYTAKHNEVNSMAGANNMMSLEYSCNKALNSDSKIGDLVY